MNDILEIITKIKLILKKLYVKSREKSIFIFITGGSIS